MNNTGLIGVLANKNNHPEVDEYSVMPVRKDDNTITLRKYNRITGEVVSNKDVTKRTFDRWKTYTTLFPYYTKDESELKDYCNYVGETQHSKLHNYLYLLKDNDYYIPMLKIFRFVKWRNIVFLSTQQLRDILDIKHPRKYLKRLQDNGLVIYEYISIRNHYRIECNPAYLFKGSAGNRRERINNWEGMKYYKDKLDTPPNKYSTENVVLDIEEGEYKEEFYSLGMEHYLYEPKDLVLLWCNDFDFSLFINNVIDIDVLEEAYADTDQQGWSTHFKSLT